MIGQRLKEIREEREYTQEYLGMKIGKCKRTISSYENNASKPKLDDFVVICETLNISSDYLLGLTDVPKSYKEKDSSSINQKALIEHINKFFEVN